LIRDRSLQIGSAERRGGAMLPRPNEQEFGNGLRIDVPESG
jgi:hypothetical protein